ncbi:type VI secretion system-associated FHA domain protein TagH [Halarcobacter ebronensis]|uniref:Type VI secretion system-associated FHA domain protein TagH n=1 Tax=Halarcobacter ebronensis TaxID=1462615 RepID=A0A4Q0YBK2_9BACT|nr:type VI secretion system-associated FHA domain protein TagH [Halarcobacter ebronensis]RXJ67325.1 type VI secretion system-associated FHA domain protein TagH [Halarcobacter ebronensis]
MKLIFDIIKNGKDFPNKRNFHFNMTDGVIGRDEGCDFHLVDTKNHISSKHAIIEYKYGIYFIKDISTNGTYLKSPYKKLPKDIAIKINSTDIFIIGDYEIQARFIDNDYGHEDIISYKSQIEHSNVNSPMRLSASLIPDDDFLLEDNTVMNNSFIVQEEENYETNNVLNIFEKESEEFEELYDFEKEPFLESSINDRNSVSTQVIHEHINLPKLNTLSQSEESFIPTKNPNELNGNSLIEILEKKLGLSIHTLSLEDQIATVEEISKIVINSLDGLKNSLGIKEKIKKDLMIDNVAPKKDDNPVLMGQYAITLLNERLDRDTLKLSEAIKKSFNELNIHNIALHRSSKNLVNIAATKFSPKSLEHYFEESGEVNGLMPKKYQMWDAYVNMFKKINESQDFGINFIAKDFSKEYNNICYTIKLTSV